MQEKTENKTSPGITVTLGGKEYNLRPLTIKESREWRKHVVELMASMVKSARLDTNEPEQYGQVIKALAVENPEKEIDLFFEYAKDLDRETIENEATDAEMALAFAKVLETASILIRGLSGVLVSLAR